MVDVWAVENAWGELHSEKTSNCFIDSLELKEWLNGAWKEFELSICQKIMDEIPKNYMQLCKKKVNQGKNMIIKL